MARRRSRSHSYSNKERPETTTKPSKRRRRRQGGHVVAQATLGLEAAYRRFDEIAKRESGLGTGKLSATETFIASPWVYGAVTAISTAISETPFKLIGYKGEQVEEGDLLRLVEYPNLYTHQNNSSKLRYTYFVELLLAGSVMRVFGEMDGMRPGTMFIDSRRRYTPRYVFDEFGRQVVTHWIRNSSRSVTFVAGDEIIHDALYNPFHEFEGLAPITAALLSVEVAMYDRQFASKYYQNDASTGIIFSTDTPGFGKLQAEEASKLWEEKAGADNAFRPKFLSFGLKPHKFIEGLDARAMQMLGALTKADVVQGIYRVPLEIFGSTDRGNQGVVIGGGSLDPIKEMFLVNVIMPWARWYDKEFNWDVSRRFSARIRGHHDFSDNPVLENRRLERARIATELIDRGVPLNEVIRWLNLEIQPQPHGDTYWVEQWRVPADVVMRAGDKILDQSQGEVRKEYINSIVRLAETTAVQNSVRNRGEQRTNSEVVKEFNGHVQDLASRVQALERTH